MYICIHIYDTYYIIDRNPVPLILDGLRSCFSPKKTDLCLMLDNVFVLRLNGKVTAASGHNSKANTERAKPGDKKTAIMMYHSIL